MASLPRPDGVPMRLQLDPCFRPCEPQEGEEIYPNGIFEFNITGLLAYIGAAGRFRAELVALGDIPHCGDGGGLSEPAIVAADLLRPVILAEIAPGRYNLIDGHHRVAKARREGVPSIPAYRIRCPEHMPFSPLPRRTRPTSSIGTPKWMTPQQTAHDGGSGEVTVAVVRVAIGLTLRRSGKGFHVSRGSRSPACPERFISSPLWPQLARYRRGAIGIGIEGQQADPRRWRMAGLGHLTPSAGGRE